MEIPMSASSTVAAIHAKQSTLATKTSKATSSNGNTTGFHAALAKVTAAKTAGTTTASKTAKVETGFGKNPGLTRSSTTTKKAAL
jgi:hypothetical protein